MPRVETFGALRQRTQTVRGARANPNIPFTGVGDVAQGVAAAAEGFERLSERLDTTAAEEANNAFEREKNDLLFNPETGYFNTQGRNAFDGVAGINKSLQDLRDRHTQALQSDRAKELFQRSADAQLQRAGVDVQRHASRGLRAWEVSTLNAQTENALENATLYWNDAEQTAVQQALGRQAVLDAAEMEGITGAALNERLQNFESSFASAAVSAAISSSSEDGQRAFDQFKSRLEGPDRIKAEKAIAARRNVEKTQRDANVAVLTATRLVDQFDSRQDIIDEVNKIDDPELRKKTMTESMTRFNQAKQARSEARGQSFEEAESHIINGGTVESFKSENPEAWERLSAGQKRKISTGQPVITDWVKFSDLMTMSRDQLAKVDPTDHFSELAPAERSKLVSAVRTAQGTGNAQQRVDSQVGRTRTAETTAAVEQIFGKRPTGTNSLKKWRQQSSVFYSLLDSEVTFREEQAGRPLTSQEYTQMLGDLSRQAVKEGRFFGTSDVPAADIFTEDTQGAASILREIGQDVNSQSVSDMLRVIDSFRERGIPIDQNLNNIQQAFIQGTQ